MFISAVLRNQFVTGSTKKIRHVTVPGGEGGGGKTSSTSTAVLHRPSLHFMIGLRRVRRPVPLIPMGCMILMPSRLLLVDASHHPIVLRGMRMAARLHDLAAPDLAFTFPNHSVEAARLLSPPKQSTLARPKLVCTSSGSKRDCPAQDAM